MNRPTLLLALLLIAIGKPAAGAPADWKPALQPRRDVRILYETRAPNASQPLQQLLSWNLERQMLRIDLPVAQVETLVDLRTHQLQLIRHDRHTITRLASRTPPGPASIPSPTLKKGATATIAGLSCVEWSTDNGATLCLTDDGVLLRATAHGVVLTQAVSVVYGMIPDQVFQPPADYRVVPAAAGGS